MALVFQKVPLYLWHNDRLSLQMHHVKSIGYVVGKCESCFTNSC